MQVVHEDQFVYPFKIYRIRGVVVEYVGSEGGVGVGGRDEDGNHLGRDGGEDLRDVGAYEGGFAWGRACVNVASMMVMMMGFAAHFLPARSCRIEEYTT